MGNVRTRADQQAEAFRQLDKDANGSITREEWQTVFANLDADGDGHITRKEWEKLTGNPVLFNLVKDPSADHQDYLSRDEWMAAFDQVDKDGDGNVSIEEWMLASMQPSDRRELTGKDARLPLEMLTRAADKQEEVFKGFNHNEEVDEFDVFEKDWVGHGRKLNAAVREALKVHLQDSWEVIAGEVMSATMRDLLAPTEGNILNVADGSVTADDFPVRVTAVKRSLGITPQDWEEAFGGYDTNKDGFVSRKEWHTVAGNTILFDMIKSGSGKRMGNMSLHEWKEGLKKADKNQDGMVNLVEWLSVALPEEDKLILMDHSDVRIKADSVLRRIKRAGAGSASGWAPSIGMQIGMAEMGGAHMRNQSTSRSSRAKPIPRYESLESFLDGAPVA